MIPYGMLVPVAVWQLCELLYTCYLLLTGAAETVNVSVSVEFNLGDTSSGVARNSRQGVRQSVAFLSVRSRSAALPSRFSLIDKNIGTSARFYA